MTVKEKELYLQIKQDPNHPLFSFLFEQNILGEITPIKGKSLKLMDDGIPFITNSTFLFMDDNETSAPFVSDSTHKSFRDISNEIAIQSPFGKNSMFYKVEREILTGQIPKL